MSKTKAKRPRKTSTVSTGEQNQIADERVQRRMLARGRRIRQHVRAVDREFHRLEADIEGFAMSVLHDRGFVVVGKKEHNALIDENTELRQQLTQAELLIVELRGAVVASAV